MSVKAKCSSDTIDKIAELRSEDPNKANDYIAQLNCSLHDQLPTGYIDKDGLVRNFPDDYDANKNQTGTCPDKLHPISINSWNILPIGQEMSKQTFCGLSTVDEANKQILIQIGTELLDTANEIYTKIKELEKQTAENYKHTGKESKKLRKELSAYKFLYKRLNELKKVPHHTLGAQVENVELLQLSSYYKYIIWTTIAGFILMTTINYLRKKTII